MSPIRQAVMSGAAALCLAAALPAQAANNGALACSVNVNYSVNGSVQETYRRDFTVQIGTAFNDDFSTPIRQKNFSASVAREAGNLAVSIDYFNDVSPFVSVGFSTRLTMRDNIETTSGGNSFGTSVGAVGNYATGYLLTCRKL